MLPRQPCATARLVVLNAHFLTRAVCSLPLKWSIGEFKEALRDPGSNSNVEPREKRRDPKPHSLPPNHSLKRCQRRPRLAVKFRTSKAHILCHRKQGLCSVGNQSYQEQAEARSRGAWWQPVTLHGQPGQELFLSGVLQTFCQPGRASCASGSPREHNPKPTPPASRRPPRAARPSLV